MEEIRWLIWGRWMPKLDLSTEWPLREVLSAFIYRPNIIIRKKTFDGLLPILLFFRDMERKKMTKHQKTKALRNHQNESTHCCLNHHYRNKSPRSPRYICFSDSISTPCWVRILDSNTFFLVSGFNPIWKILVKMGIFPKFRDEHKKSLSCHHPAFFHGPAEWKLFKSSITTKGPRHRKGLSANSSSKRCKPSATSRHARVKASCAARFFWGRSMVDLP